MAEQQESRQVQASELAETMTAIAETSQKLLRDYARRGHTNGHDPDPLNLNRSFLELVTRLMSDPQTLVQAQVSLWQDYLRVWQHTAQKLLGC